MSMRPKIGIAGFGLEGQATYAFLKDGVAVTVFDERVPDGLPAGVPFVQSLSIPADIAVVYKSPGIPTSKLTLASRETRITTLMEAVLERVRERAIGVTGTKGKSTVASLIHHILTQAGKDAALMGNIGVLDLGLMQGDAPERLYVLELSSYQCEHLTRSPHVAVLTNFFPEHLSHHGSLEAYREAKLNVARFQESTDLFIDGSDLGVRFKGRVELPGAAPRFETKLLGAHNQRNCALAFAAVRAVGVSEAAARAAIATFEPLAYRLEKVGTHRGVTFYDDSLATVPQATLASLDALGHVDTLILGGEDRGVPLSAFAETLAGTDIGTFIAFPDTGEKMTCAVKDRTVAVSTMEAAVKAAYERTAAGGVVLLSNASPSFNLFKDYKDKSAQYRKWIEALGGGSVAS